MAKSCGFRWDSDSEPQRRASLGITERQGVCEKEGPEQIPQALAYGESLQESAAAQELSLEPLRVPAPGAIARPCLLPDMLGASSLSPRHRLLGRVAPQSDLLFPQPWV